MGNETPDRGSSETPPRPPTLKDLAQICAELNRLGARYVVIGGWAMIQEGYLLKAQGVTVRSPDSVSLASPGTRWWTRLKSLWKGKTAD